MHNPPKGASTECPIGLITLVRVPGALCPALKALVGSSSSPKPEEAHRTEAGLRAPALPTRSLAERGLSTVEGRKSKARKTPSPSYLLNCSEL